jgi:hypothetical protein
MWYSLLRSLLSKNLHGYRILIALPGGGAASERRPARGGSCRICGKPNTAGGMNRALMYIMSILIISALAFMVFWFVIEDPNRRYVDDLENQIPHASNQPQ